MATTDNTQPKPRKVRGTGIYVGDEFTFKPTEEGSPSQLNVKKQVAHLSCNADAADPWGEYTGQLLKLGIKPQDEQQLPTKQRIVSEGGMQVYLDAKRGRLTYQGDIDLNATRNWQSDLMRQLQIVVRTLPGEEKFKKVINKIKNGGNKR